MHLINTLFSHLIIRWNLSLHWKKLASLKLWPQNKNFRIFSNSIESKTWSVRVMQYFKLKKSVEHTGFYLWVIRIIWRGWELVNLLGHMLDVYLDTPWFLVTHGPMNIAGFCPEHHWGQHWRFPALQGWPTNPPHFRNSLELPVQQDGLGIPYPAVSDQYIIFSPCIEPTMAENHWWEPGEHCWGDPSSFSRNR